MIDKQLEKNKGHKIQEAIAESQGFLRESIVRPNIKGEQRTKYHRVRDVSTVMCKHLTQMTQSEICELHGLSSGMFKKTHDSGIKIIKDTKQMARSLDKIIKRFS